MNAAIRAVGKAALGHYGMEVIGFLDGFRGVAEDRWVRLDRSALAGILTVGGTILGTGEGSSKQEAQQAVAAALLEIDGH